MFTYKESRDQVLQLFDELIAFAADQKRVTIKENLEKARKHLEIGKLIVVICGEYKQGKSSLINAFLNEVDLFPVEVDITTSLVTTITYGAKEKITVLLGSGAEKQISRQDIPKYVTEQENSKNFRDAQMLVIESPNTQLKDGLVFADTPGIGSLNKQHTAVTMGFIPSADVALFVSDVTAPLQQDELSFIQNTLAPNCRYIIFVFTKIDLVREYKVVIDSNKEKLEKLLGPTKKPLMIVAVSSVNKNDYLTSKDEDDLKDSGFEEFESLLWKVLGDQRGKMLLSIALQELNAGITGLENPLKLEKEVYEVRNKQEIERLQSEFKKEIDRLKSLQGKNSSWVAILNEEIPEIASSIKDQLNSALRKLSWEKEQYLEDLALLNNPPEIQRKLEEDVNRMMFAFSRDLNYQAEKLYIRLEEEIDIRVGFSMTLLKVDESDLKLEQENVKNLGWLDKTFTVARSAMFTGSAGAFLGGVFGGLIGGVIGSAMGGVGAVPGAAIGAAWGQAIVGILGAGKGIFDGLNQMKQAEINEVKSKIARKLNILLDEYGTSCNKSVTSAIREIKDSIKKQLEEKIKRAKENVEENLKSLQQAQQKTEEQARARLEALTVPLQWLALRRKRLDALGNAIAEDSSDQKSANV